MGNAWMGLSNSDDMTIYYNPASLGANYDIDLTPISLTIGAPNAVDDYERFTDIPSDPVEIVDQLLGYPFYLEASNYSTIKAQHFSFSYFTSNKAGVLLQNQANPVFDVDFSYDRGFITGFAYNLIGGGYTKKKEKIMRGNRLSVGYSLKYLTREATKDSFDAFSTNILGKISDGLDSLDNIKDIFGYSKGSGLGHDLGIEWAAGRGNSEFVASLAFLDIGDTEFDFEEGTNGDVPSITMQINSGFAFKQDWKFFDYAIALDLKPLNQGLDFGRTVHVGTMINIPFVGIFLGFSEGYQSYGAEVRLWPVTITAGFNSAEIGNDFRETQGERLFIYLSLLDTSFDIY